MPFLAEEFDDATFEDVYRLVHTPTDIVEPPGVLRRHPLTLPALRPEPACQGV
jgi:hypothetical protein